MATSPGKRKPQRTCIACRRTEDKRGLIRLVRSEGRVAVDETGRASGRGAYLCHDAGCWETALRRGTVSRALKLGAGLNEEERRVLTAYAERLGPTVAEGGGQ